MRDQQSGNWIHSAGADCRYGLRQLRKNPGFTFVAVLTLALGIGATTAIFSVVYGVLLRPLPYPEANRIVAVFEVNSKGNPSRLADPNFDDFRDQSRSFQAIAKYSDYVVSVSGGVAADADDVAQRLDRLPQGLSASQPILGRDFTAADAKNGAGPDRARQRRLLEAASRIDRRTSRRRT